MKWRLALGVLCVIGSCLWFLPVLGLWMLPLGLLLMARDVPRMRWPVSRFMFWLDDKRIALRERWPRRD